MTGQGKSRSDSISRAGGAQRVSSDAGASASEALRGTAEQVTDRIKDKAGELKQEAKETAHDVRQRARSAVDQQKHAAVGQVEGIAHALRTASDELRDQGQPMVAEYSRHAAEGLENMAQSLDRREMGEFVENIEQFARERPVAFIGGAMVAGFALARFMKSSSPRRSRRTGADRGVESADTRTGAGAGTPRAGSGTTASGDWPAGDVARDAGSIGAPGTERDAGTIATPGPGTAGTLATGSAGTQGGAGRPGTRSPGTPDAGRYGRSEDGEI
jgi:hypothetical protein